ncbi:MAG TPA: sulfotransferase family 2 domain-containing protein [Holophagaceae bacterium]|jgi:hypothetical protein|nr:sulfotransferase family 2 domain-containing protein [Holophagaceae bacterium]
MIISRRHRYIFFPIPKTGTHSVRQALREHMGDQDLEQVGLFVHKRFPFQETAHIPHGHLSVAEIRPAVGEEVFGSYLKFAFVRNPFDRFVSYCAFRSRATNQFEIAPVPFMKHILREERPLGHVHYLPQHTFLTDGEGRMAMDFVGKTETMQADYDAICARLGFPSRVLDRVNGSSHRPYQEYYDQDLIGWVSELYQKDLELFGYTFE